MLTEANCPYRRVFEQEIQSRGVNPHSSLEITSLKVLQNMVQAGLGVGVVPTAIVRTAPENTVLRNIAGLKLELPMGITLSSEKSIPGLALNRLIIILQRELTEPKKN